MSIGEILAVIDIDRVQARHGRAFDFPGIETAEPTERSNPRKEECAVGPIGRRLILGAGIAVISGEGLNNGSMTPFLSKVTEDWGENSYVVKLMTASQSGLRESNPSRI